MRVVQILQRSGRVLGARPSALARAFSSLPEHEVVGLPALSPTMEMGTISAWLKKEGDKINAGDVICQVETDKAVVDFEAQDDSYLAKILKPEGTADIKVGEPIFVTVDDASSVAALATFSINAATPAAAAPAAAPIAAPVAATPAPVSAAPAAAPAANTIAGRVVASPLAKKIARESGVSLAGVSGSGPLGRIIRADVEEALARVQSQPAASAAVPAAAAPAASTAAPVVHGDYTDLPLSAKAQAFAAQLTQQKLDVPHYHLTIDVTLDKLLAARELLNKSRAESEQLSVNDFILRAAALTMKKVPAANSAWMGTFVRQFHNVNISMMMSVDGGVVAPVLRNTNLHGLDGINADVRTLVEKVTNENSDLADDDFEGGTFTISNVGMYDVKSLAAIVSPNQACSLGLGAIAKRVVPNDDPEATQIYKFATQMTATLACDHRVIDGATGAQWLASFKELVEDPLRMIL
ncbi:dihydrolipoamide acetyltransferase [Achlya hypogyna]|uniref:Acetyltransferase component of pyruvate dehydrogenase complex n=1 Tax=Achlya hypogyna TaxID=1202772 RepID=A0A1V9ZUW0_ACHHY|nr:dihydrolipoamide acetyltransferase [Achlya hypogyna]